MIELKVKMLDDGIPAPRYQHDGDAGLDLPSRIDYVLQPGERAMIPTGVSVAVPHGYAGFVMIRSGLAARHGIACVNSPGLIDAGYRGELMIIMLNTDRYEPFHVRRGERIAQLVLQKVIEATIIPVADLDGTTRGDGGFGSTGRN